MNNVQVMPKILTFNKWTLSLCAGRFLHLYWI